MSNNDGTAGHREGRGNDEPASFASALPRARQAGLAELKLHPRATSWRRDATRAVLLVFATTLVVLAAGAWFSIVEVERVKGHLPTLLLLFAVQGLGVFAALAPGQVMLRRAAALLALGAAVAIVASRGAGTSSATAPFACSTSHFAVDLIPLGFVILALRRFSVTIGRSLLAGVAAAVTGAIAGELSCGRGWSHVLVHHVGAALAVAIACVLLARIRPPRSFAP